MTLSTKRSSAVERHVVAEPDAEAHEHRHDRRQVADAEGDLGAQHEIVTQRHRDDERHDPDQPRERGSRVAANASKAWASVVATMNVPLPSARRARSRLPRVNFVPKRMRPPV